MKELLELLKLHRGRDRAITARRLSETLDSEERDIRTGIRNLIAGGIPIASSVVRPYGYFIVTSVQEANDYMKSLRERLIEDALRRRDFRLAVAKYNGSGQLKLF